MSESDGKLLARMGTDPRLWAQEFVRIKAEIEAADDGRVIDEGGMLGWFASALEAGRHEGRQETCPHDDVFTLSDDLESCRTCGMLFHYVNGVLVES